MKSIGVLGLLGILGCSAQEPLFDANGNPTPCADGSSLKDIHLQVLFAYDLAAFDNGRYAGENRFFHKDLILTMYDLAAWYGKADVAMYHYGDKSPYNERQCTKIHHPFVSANDAAENMFDWTDKHDLLYWKRYSMEGSQLTALRYAMRAEGWRAEAVDEDGLKVVKVIFVITDTAGEVGTDETDLSSDPSDCDQYDYPSMAAMKADQQKYFSDGIFLLVGDVDYPEYVRDPVTAFVEDTLPYYLNGARGKSARGHLGGDHHDLTTRLLKDAACGLIGENPTSGPFPPVHPTVPMSTTPTTVATTTATPAASCPNGLSFDDVRLQVMVAYDMGAFRYWNPQPIRDAPMYLDLDIMTYFKAAEIGLILYSDRTGPGLVHCARRVHQFLPPGDATSLAGSFLSSNSFWGRTSPDGSFFQMLRFAFAYDKWIREPVDEQGRKVYNIIVTFTDAPGQLGSDEEAVSGDFYDCDSHDYPTATAVSRELEALLPNAKFIVVGSHKSTTTTVDAIDNFNNNVLPNILNNATGQAVAADINLAMAAHDVLMKIVCDEL